MRIVATHLGSPLLKLAFGQAAACHQSLDRRKVTLQALSRLKTRQFSFDIAPFSIDINSLLAYVGRQVGKQIRTITSHTNKQRTGCARSVDLTISSSFMAMFSGEMPGRLRSRE